MTLSKTIEIMSKKNIRRLPITDKDSVRENLVGIITEKDIINAIVKPSRKLELVKIKSNIAPSDRIYRNFEEARRFVHSLDLHSRKEWERYCKSGQKPKDIPYQGREASRPSVAFSSF